MRMVEAAGLLLGQGHVAPVFLEVWFSPNKKQ